MLFSSRRPVRSSPSPFDTPQFRYAMYGVVVLLLILVQLALSNVIAIANITPDFVLIVVLLIALFEGRLHGAIAGFVAGLFLDIASGGILGSHALVKTIGGFLLGHLHRPTQFARQVGTYRFPLAVFFVSVLHNLIYFFFYIQPMDDTSLLSYFALYGLGTSAYTTIWSLIPMLVIGRKKGL